MATPETTGGGAMDTPMYRQYREIRARNPDALLFFRMGDFYELFGEDAVWTAAALELTLTSRNKGAVDEVPMCGLPYHAAESYLKRLLDLGKKVAIAEQVEDPRQAKGIVRREVVRVLTPGLTAEGVEAHESAWLVAVTGGPGAWGLARLDVSTGDLRVTEPPHLDALLAELARVEPRELLVSREADDPELRAAARAPCVSTIEEPHDPLREVQARFGDGAVAGLGPGVPAVAALLRYAAHNLGGGGPSRHLDNVRELKVYVLGSALELDDATRRNLELFRPLRGAGRVGTLVHLLDDASTPMGGRLLREWLGAPLVDVTAISARQDAVAAFVTDASLRRTVRDLLGGVADLERLSARVVQRIATPRELGALRGSLERLPALHDTLEAGPGTLAGRLPMDLVPDLVADLATWLVDEPPAASGEGGVIRPGADPELDRLRTLSRDAKGAIAAMESGLRAQTGVSSLKIRANGVFGYYIEVTKANLDRVPTSWHRKQTIANGERFITAELKEYEEQVSGAEERLMALELARFTALRDRIAAEIARIAVIARAVAEVDVYATFAEVAVRFRYVRPVVDRSTDLEIVAGRHPVIEAVRREERFVPNDVALDAKARLVVLTGPNMAGKSTLMRQIALIVLLAQAGAWVPATRARVGACDRICVRVGASDDISRGQSTFMVEMAETANILAAATGRTLVLLDEIGRGTSTYDGLAIAWAVAEDLHNRVRCRAVFATHYHELTALPESCPAARNLHVSASEHGERLVFLRTVKEGPAPGSYGIQCARLAGLPPGVVARARDLLDQLERRRPRPEATQLSLFGAPPADALPSDATPTRRGKARADPAPLVDPVRVAVQDINPDALSPREALEVVYRLRALL